MAVHLANSGDFGCRLPGIQCVRNSRNNRAAGTYRFVLVLIWLAALASALILYRECAPFRTRSAVIGLGAALGGAAGNLIDILQRRPIIDFIDLTWWPVFNVADAAITLGILFAFWR